MTKEQAKQNLIGFGIAEPTDEQITNYLNQIGAETKKEKDRADGYKVKADQADEYKRKLEEAEAKDLDEAEKSARALQAANDRIAELEKNQMIADRKSAAVEKFKVTAEQASRIVKEDGTFDFDVLGQIIAEKETAAAAAKEQELLKDTPNPGGGAGGGQGDQKTDDVKNAESITFGSVAAEKSAQDFYVLK